MSNVVKITDKVIKNQENFWNNIHFHPTDAIEDDWGQKILNEVAKDNVADTSPLWNVGISQLIGGAILLVAGLCMGGGIPEFNLKSILVFTYICSASIIAYVLFNWVQKYSKNSTLLIIKFAEPLCACIFGAILLGEDIFKLQYLIAFVLISLGIFLGSKKEAEE